MCEGKKPLRCKSTACYFNLSFSFFNIKLDDFVVDTVVSSSELLSDISDSNVITFDDPHESLQLDTSLELNHIYVAAGILAVSLLALAFLVRVSNSNWILNYRI